MEYLQGEDLDVRLERQRKLGLQETLGITMQVARALGRAHAAGLVHRDLKPANIFLVHDDDREIAKVLDFGIAKSQSIALSSADSKTKTGSVMGTPYYMSPEQAQGTKEVDHRSDLWALAVVVYQCITGQLPFDSMALGDLFVKIIVHPIPVPSRVAVVPAGFDAWWARATQRDPNERFQSAKELADALGPALGLAAAGADPSLLSRASGADLPRPSIADPVSDGGSWPGAGPAARLHTVGPVVAALTAAPADRGRRSLAPLIAGAVFVVALGLGAAFLLLRGAPVSQSPQRPIAADPSPTAAAPVPTIPAVDPVVAAPIVSAAPVASAAAPIVSAAPPVVAVVPTAKTPIAKTPPPKVANPATTAPKGATPKPKTDFGI
jgi:serine/threonine-protein kinase